MKKFVTLAATAAVLALPASASAETVKQKGEIVDDSETRVSLKVEVNGLGPVSVEDFKARNVFSRCDGEPSRLDFTALSPIPVKGDGTFKDRLRDDNDGVLRIEGKIKDGGKAAVGTLKTNEIQSDDGKICRTPKQTFKTAAN